ncbi:hypothetical protein F4805DRAFT_267200 [Annulohypoxylon moriforme]|nr:hypothetical protein F4805DRAFT_267200 [Annulohypoxylon moriforme]
MDSPVHMTSRVKNLPEPIDFIIRVWAEEDIETNELSTCLSLLLLIGEVLHDQKVKQSHVVNFIRLVSTFRQRFNSTFAIRYVLFHNIVLNLTFASNSTLDPHVLDPIPLLLRLAVDTKLRQHLRLGAVQPFTRRDLARGLKDIYVSPHVSISQPQPIIYNFQFHIFASSLYRSGAIRKPVFFVCAMVDALERRWEDARRLSLALYAVHWWIMHFGYRLFKQNSTKKWIYPKFVRHGDLYEEHLDRVLGKKRPRPALTVGRWRFWKKRLEESMIDVVDFESNFLLSGSNNIARQAAEEIGHILLKNGYKV